MLIGDPKEAIGQFFGGVDLETCTDQTVSRPRVKPIMVFPPEMRVEFPRKLRDTFPLGTRFKATVKVCQKHIDGEPHGPPYLRAYDIAVIASTVRDAGIMAKVKSGSISGLAYEYVWVTKS
jgi:hypothetical protein